MELRGKAAGLKQKVGIINSTHTHHPPWVDTSTIQVE